LSVVLPRLGLLTLLLGLAALLSVSTGAARIPIPEILPALAGRAEGTSRSILLHLRLPRVVLAMGVGGALALAGTTFQALLRNPLAEPYVLGISGGAAVGAVAVLVGGLGASVPGAVPLGAFVGALVAMFLVLRVAMAAGGRRLDPRVLILSGVVVGAFFNAVILLLLSIADVESFRSAIFWMMGNLSGATWGGNAMLALYIVPGSLLLLSLARPFDLLARGEDVAFHLGTRVDRTKFVAYVVASLLVAAAVAAAGVIGFVGLIVPHAIRLLWGPGHRLLLPASFLAGAVFLLLADTAARVIVAPAELPTGVVTALAGVPLFIVLLVRRGVR
jgi:iron complex transport system permease protein